MYIVQLTTARQHPADGNHDDVTCPVFVTGDLLNAVAFARRIDEHGRNFIASETQGIRIFAAAEDLPDFDADRVIFSRVPHRVFPKVGADDFIWHERWHEPRYERHHAELAAKM